MAKDNHLTRSFMCELFLFADTTEGKYTADSSTYVQNMDIQSILFFKNAILLFFIITSLQVIFRISHSAQSILLHYGYKISGICTSCMHTHGYKRES